MKLGEELLSKSLRRLKLSKEIKMFHESYKNFGFSDSNSLLVAIGSGEITVRAMIRKLYPQKSSLNENSNYDRNFLDLALKKLKA